MNLGGGPWGTWGGLTPIPSAHVEQRNPWGIEEPLSCPLSPWGYGDSGGLRL